MKTAPVWELNGFSWTKNNYLLKFPNSLNSGDYDEGLGGLGYIFTVKGRHSLGFGASDRFKKH